MHPCHSEEEITEGKLLYCMLHYLHIFYVPIVDAMYRYYGKYTLSNGILGFKKITLYGSFLWKRFIVKSE